MIHRGRNYTKHTGSEVKFTIYNQEVVQMYLVNNNNNIALGRHKLPAQAESNDGLS